MICFNARQWIDLTKAMEGGVGVDAALVLGVLQAVLLDVVPQLLDDLGARHRLAADHGGQLGAAAVGAGGGGQTGGGRVEACCINPVLVKTPATSGSCPTGQRFVMTPTHWSAHWRRFTGRRAN